MMSQELVMAIGDKTWTNTETKSATLLRWTVSRLNDWKGKAPYNISKTYFGHPCKIKLTPGKQGVSETSFRHSFNV